MQILNTYLLTLTLLEESVLALLLVALLPGEVVLAANLLNNAVVDTADVDLGLGRDHVAGVDASERDTVDLEWTGDEEDTLWEVLEEDDTLATEATGEEDQNGTRLERLADLGWADGLASLWQQMISMLFADVCASNVFSRA